MVRWALSHINPNKAAGPDGVSGWLLKYCAGQLTAVFLEQATVPTSLKCATIIKTGSNQNPE